MFPSKRRIAIISIFLIAHSMVTLALNLASQSSAYADDLEEFRSKNLSTVNLNFAFVRAKKGGSGIEFFEVTDAATPNPLIRRVDKNSLQLTIQANSEVLNRSLSTQAQALALLKLASKAKGVNVLVMAPGTLENKWVALYSNAEGQIEQLSSEKALGKRSFDPTIDPSFGFAAQVLGSLGYNATVLRAPSGRIEVYTPLTANLTGKQAVVFASKNLNPKTIEEARACAVIKLIQKTGSGTYLAELILGDNKTWPNLIAAKAHIE